MKSKDTLKFGEVQDFIKSSVTTRWNMGLSMSTHELKGLLLIKCEKDDWMEWSRVYGRICAEVKGTRLRDKSLHTFIRRSLNKFGFTIRKKTVSQSIPEDWLSLVKKGAARVRERFMEEDVDVVLAADETFIRFHESYDTVLAPIGEKRIGSTARIDNKMGCTVLPTMDMSASCLLPPMIIFTGVFGGYLMKRWRNYSNSLVLFTEKHWMTSNTFILYLDWLMDFFKGKKIGLIVDYAPSHTDINIDDWVQKLNESKKHLKTKLIIEWIDKGLTSIYQPGDISVNKPLKDHIKQKYHAYVAEEVENFCPGQPIRVTREQMVGFIETAVNEINMQQKTTHSVYRSFKTCGLNPWDKTLDEFDNHLKSLDMNKLYQVLNASQKALDL